VVVVKNQAPICAAVSKRNDAVPTHPETDAGPLSAGIKGGCFDCVLGPRLLPLTVLLVWPSLLYGSLLFTRYAFLDLDSRGEDVRHMAYGARLRKTEDGRRRRGPGYVPPTRRRLGRSTRDRNF
jgi:hypothetical protein